MVLLGLGESPPLAARPLTAESFFGEPIVIRADEEGWIDERSGQGAERVSLRVCV